MNATVKGLLTSVHILPKLSLNISGTLYDPQCVIYNTLYVLQHMTKAGVLWIKNWYWKINAYANSFNFFAYTNADTSLSRKLLSDRIWTTLTGIPFIMAQSKLSQVSYKATLAQKVNHTQRQGLGEAEQRRGCGFTRMDITSASVQSSRQPPAWLGAAWPSNRMIDMQIRYANRLLTGCRLRGGAASSSCHRLTDGTWQAGHVISVRTALRG